MIEEESTKGGDLTALTRIVSALEALDETARRRVFDAVATFFGFSPEPSRSHSPSPSHASTTASFSSEQSISPKEFMLEKQPRTDVHRIACLAYYLTHFRDMPHFKTIDLSKLNTEAAQPKFSNAAKSVDNATSYGYLAQATKGNKQLSGAGERFVQALPDMDAAKAALAATRPRKKNKKRQDNQAENGNAED